MKSPYCSLSRRGRAEVLLSLLLSIGIVVALLLPSGSNQESPSAPASIFTLVESDYASPLFSSASGIRTLNAAAKEIAQFAGYDDFHTRVELNGSMSVVNVTRFCGDLLSILNIGFALRDTQHKNAACIYISEALWNFVFNRKLDIIGTPIRLHQTVYRIAGVTRSFTGLLAGTEIWIPINSRSQLGGINSMRILGSLVAGADWKIAQRQLTNVFKFSLTDPTYVADSGARLLPVNRSITFQQQIPSIVTTIGRAEMQKRITDHQPAALPLSRGS
jgi:hypothetical protein